MEKRIITWRWGNNADHDEHTSTRAFIFGNYGWSVEDYAPLIAEAKRDFSHLTDADIEISRVTKSSYMKGVKVIAFSLPDNETHPDYEDHDSFDFNY